MALVILRGKLWNKTLINIIFSLYIWEEAPPKHNKFLRVLKAKKRARKKRRLYIT